jgi:hypothetical protein
MLQMMQDIDSYKRIDSVADKRHDFGVKDSVQPVTRDEVGGKHGRQVGFQVSAATPKLDHALGAEWEMFFNAAVILSVETPQQRFVLPDVAVGGQFLLG